MTSEATHDRSLADPAPHLAPYDEHVSYKLELIFPDPARIAHWTYEPPFGGAPLTWSGPCPKCGEDTSVGVPELVAEGVDLQEVSEPVSVQVRQFPCMCRGDHAARPERVVRGCGRYWLGRVQYLSDGTYALSVEVDASKEPRTQAIEIAIRSEGAWAKTLAEKWIGGVTALLGLLSVAGIVTGADAAKNVRDDLRWLVFVVAVIALMTAGLAIFFAYRAAFGPTAFARLRNEADEIKWFERQVSTPRRTVSLLRTSIALTVASLLCAFGVATLLWFLPGEKPADQCVVQGRGTCQVS